MNKKGFTLVELLATIVVLGILVGITVVASTGIFKNTKEKTEGVFIKTIEDALNMYLDSSARKLNFNYSSVVCVLDKTHGKVNLYKATDDLTFNDVLESDYSPLTINDLVNPANKDTDKYQCSATGTLNIYRDADYVYYYRIDKSGFGCLNSTGILTNLPSGCNG